MRITSWLLVLISCASIASREASADAGLSWVRLPGAESCVTYVELASKVDALLSDSPWALPEDATLSIEAWVGPGEGQQFVATVRVAARDGRVLGVREIASTTGTCRELDDPIALIVALALDPRSSWVELPTSLLPGPQDASERLLAELNESTTEGRAPAPAQETAEPRPLRALPSEASSTARSFEAGAGAGWGRAPLVAPVVFAGGAKSWRPLGVHARGMAAVPTWSQHAGGRVWFGSLEAELDVCLERTPNERQRYFALCVGPRGGGVWVWATGYDRGGFSLSPLLDVLVRADIGVVGGMTHLLFVGAELAVPLLRPEFSVRNEMGEFSAVYETPPLRVSAYVGVRFGR